MVTTVKISDAMKRKLDELQAKLLLRQHEKVNLQVLLERLLEYALKNAVNLLGMAAGEGERIASAIVEMAAELLQEKPLVLPPVAG